MSAWDKSIEYKGALFAEPYLDRLLLGAAIVPEKVARQVCEFKGLDPDATTNRFGNKGITHAEDYQMDIGHKILDLKDKKPKKNGHYKPTWLLSGGILVALDGVGHIFPCIQLACVNTNGEPDNWFTMRKD